MEDKRGGGQKEGGGAAKLAETCEMRGDRRKVWSERVQTWSSSTKISARLMGSLRARVAY